MFKTAMGYPDRDGERHLLDLRADRTAAMPTVDPVVATETVSALQRSVETVSVDTSLRDYIVDLARATRADSRVEVGVSPRGIQRAFEAVRAAALLAGRTYAVPDDVKRVVEPVFAHRLVLTTEATVDGVDPAAIATAVCDRVDVPPDAR